MHFKDKLQLVSNSTWVAYSTPEIDLSTQVAPNTCGVHLIRTAASCAKKLKPEFVAGYREYVVAFANTVRSQASVLKDIVHNFTKPQRNLTQQKGNLTDLQGNLTELLGNLADLQNEEL